MNVEELPLAGVKVVDLSMYLAGPMCGRALGEWGAEVIKVEPLEGDAYRYAGMGLMFPKDENMNVMYQMFNACKRHIALDMKQPEGIEIMMKLLAEADVLVTSFRTPALEKMGLRYEDLCERFPRLIFAQVTGYGEKGPDCDKPGYDTCAFFSRTGIMTDLVPKGADPLLTTNGMGDSTVSMFLAAGVATALYRQQRTGKGCKVSSSLLGGGLYTQSLAITTGQEPFYSTVKNAIPEDEYGSHLGNLVPTSGLYKCADGEWLFMALPNPKTIWKRFSLALGKEDWAENEAMAEVVYQVVHHREITEELDRIFATKTCAEWEAVLTRYDVAHQRCKHFEDQFKDPQVLENNFAFKQKFQNGESCLMVSNPIQFSVIPADRELPPPGKIGQDSGEILRELGYSPDEIAALLEKKVTRMTPA
jgi:crotonobetainyl-CoA:carnitine CoA-transferase CaiB-like acyl-CoA transferase